MLLFLLVACGDATAFAEPVIYQELKRPDPIAEFKAEHAERKPVPLFGGEPYVEDPYLKFETPDPRPPPYSGWERWCEPRTLRVCKTKADCGGIDHPANKPMKCIRPWYVEKDSSYRVCSPGMARRAERKEQRARIRDLMAAQYFGGGGGAGFRDRKRADRLAKLLQVVAQRETTMRPWKRHRLNGDIKASKNAYESQAGQYGHKTLTKPVVWRGRRVQQVIGMELLVDGNEHYAQRWRWEYGLGMYGQLAPYWTATWAADAPPEVLCRLPEASETYLRGLRRSWRKIAGGIDCDKDGEREWHGTGGHPTWHDVHRATSGGKLCPGPGTRFDKRALRVGLDPYQRVRLGDLGQPIPREGQNERADQIRDLLEVMSGVRQSMG